MEVCCRHLSRLPGLSKQIHHLVPADLRHYVQKRGFHDYWVQKTPEGQSLRIPILKARHHLGALSSRGDRAENEDRFKVGLMNKLATTDERQPFYFAIIDGYSLTFKFG